MEAAAATVLVRLPQAEVMGRKMITSLVVAMVAAMASSAEATATEVPEVLEVVTKAVASAVAPATRVVIIAKDRVTERWSRRRTPSSCRA